MLITQTLFARAHKSQHVATTCMPSCVEPFTSSVSDHGVLSTSGLVHFDWGSVNTVKEGRFRDPLHPGTR